MHDINFIRENPAKFDYAFKRRNLSLEDRDKYSSKRVIEIDDARRNRILELERRQKERNEINAEIAQAKSAGINGAEFTFRNSLILLREDIHRLERERDGFEQQLKELLSQIPNIPFDAPEVPDGADANANVERYKYGKLREFRDEEGKHFQPKEHFDLGESLGQMDFEVAAKLSGSRFVVLKGAIARLERALAQFMLDIHTTKHGYTEVAPPLLVRDDVMFGTAQLPKFADDQFKTALIRDRKPRKEFVANLLPHTTHTVGLLAGQRNPNLALFTDQSDMVQLVPGSTVATVSLFVNTAIANTASTIVKAGLEDPEINERRWLIPTGEVPLTNLVRDSIVVESKLPMRLTACTPCFRQEAGAAGKDARGMIRQHQFTKVELVSITTPEQSKDEHERMLSCAETILRKLELPYRVVTLCAGDMGFASQKTYDIEVWLPGQNKYREISSCSVCGDFQARRMNARYKNKQGRNIPLHTLNGSGVAVGRALIAVMETYQQEDGSIAVPDALLSYMGGMKTIEKQ